MRRQRMLIIVALMILMSTAACRSAQAQSQKNRQGLLVSFSYTPVYQFETDLDKGGNFNVHRHYLNFDIKKRFTQNFGMGLGLSYAYEGWHFNDLSSVAGATPWSTVHRPGISMPLVYTFEGNWILGFSPTVEFSGESGAHVDESLTYGGVLSLIHPFSRNLFLGLGLGLFDRLEETSFFPFIIINWKVSEQFRIANPFRAGPAGPAGLEFIYAPNEKWEIGAGGAYRKYRFRLNDDSAVPEGVGTNEFLVTFVRLQRKLGKKGMTLDLVGGAMFEGKLSIENVSGKGLARDEYGPSPVVGITFASRF